MGSLCMTAQKRPNLFAYYLAKEHAIKSDIFSAGSKAIRCAAVNAVEWRALSKLTNKADDRFRTRP